jgi:mRNA interferase ChpB
MEFGVEITGIKTTGLIRCYQPRVLDLEERGARRVESLPADLLTDVMAKVIILFE